jgi:hypothetical protein
MNTQEMDFSKFKTAIARQFSEMTKHPMFRKALSEL